MTNYGAFLFEPQALTAPELHDAIGLAGRFSATREAVHTNGRYGALKWFQVGLERELPVCATIFAKLGITDADLLVLYYLEPGAHIHPHRDLTGAGLNNRIRFHVPIVTNPDVEFIVDGKRVVMKPGDLWCLDTSYTHSVRNNGDASRVHLVIECDLTPRLRQRLPSNIATKAHTAAFAGIMAYKLGQSLIVNSWKDPAYFRDQMKLVAKFVAWRLLGRGKANATPQTAGMTSVTEQGGKR